MNLQRHSIFAIVIVLFILVAVIVFNLILSIPYGEGMPSGDYFTSTAIIAHNQTIEAQIYQTQTATVQAATGTFTPVSSS